MQRGKSTIATTAFARSRLPRSLLTAHSAAADVGFVGVWGLPLGGNRGKRFTMAVLLFSGPVIFYEHWKPRTLKFKNEGRSKQQGLLLYSSDRFESSFESSLCAKSGNLLRFDRIGAFH